MLFNFFDLRGSLINIINYKIKKVFYSISFTGLIVFDLFETKPQTQKVLKYLPIISYYWLFIKFINIKFITNPI